MQKRDQQTDLIEYYVHDGSKFQLAVSLSGRSVDMSCPVSHHKKIVLESTKIHTYETHMALHYHYDTNFKVW